MPSEPSTAHYNVYLISDAYIGLDQDWSLSVRVNKKVAEYEVLDNPNR